METSPAFSPFVAEERHRSQTVIVANCAKPSADVIKAVKEAGLVVGSGYGTHKESQIRIANFPATSPEQINRLISELKKI